MATLPCPPSAAELIAAEVAKYDPRGPFGQRTDEINAEQANASEGLLGVPLLDNLIKQATNFTATAVGQFRNDLVTGALADIAGSTVAATAITSLLAAIGTFTDTMSMLFQLLMVDNLRKQVAIRMLWLNIVLNHYKAIYNLLLMLKGPNTTSNYARLLLALKHVKSAQADINKFKILDNTNSSMPRLKFKYFNNAFIESNQALEILLSDVNPSSATGTSAAAAVGKSISTKGFNKTTFSQAWRETIITAKKELQAKVIGQTLYIMQGLAWHLARLYPPVPLPGSQIITDIMSGLNNAVAQGYVTGTPFGSDEAQAQIDNITEQGLNIYNSVTPTAQSINLINQYDFQKGLTGTNLVIDGYIQTLTSFDSQWANITKLTNYLLVSVVPIDKLLSETQQGIQDSINNKDSDAVVATKESIWIGYLTALNSYEGLIGGGLAGELQRENQALALDDIIAYLKSPVVQDANNALVISLLLRIQAISPWSLLSSRALNEGLVTVNLGIRQATQYLQYNQQLFNKLGEASLDSDPSMSSVTTLLGALNASGGVAAVMANSIQLGQMTQLAGSIASVIAGIVGGTSAISVPKCISPPNCLDYETVLQNDRNMAMQNQITNIPTSPVTIP